jgi:hypothetical protein
MKNRPIGVTILAVLAAVAAIFAGIRVLQFLGLIPFWFGPIPFRSFSLFAALMWGLLVWVYVWLVKMLWDVNPQGWLFLAVISVFNLILEFVNLVGGAEMNDVAIPFILNGLILIYVLLPGTKKAFEVE